MYKWRILLDSLNAFPFSSPSYWKCKFCARIVFFRRVNLTNSPNSRQLSQWRFTFHPQAEVEKWIHSASVIIIRGLNWSTMTSTIVAQSPRVSSIFRTMAVLSPLTQTVEKHFFPNINSRRMNDDWSLTIGIAKSGQAKRGWNNVLNWIPMIRIVFHYSDWLCPLLDKFLINSWQRLWNTHISWIAKAQCQILRATHPRGRGERQI